MDLELTLGVHRRAWHWLCAAVIVLSWSGVMERTVC